MAAECRGHGLRFRPAPITSSAHLLALAVQAKFAPGRLFVD